MKQLKETPWLETAVFICTKCHNDIDPQKLSLEGNAGENLKNYLKENLRNRQLTKKCRVMTCSCLGICPEGQQALHIQNLKDNKFAPIMIIDPEKEKIEFLELLLSKLK